METEAKLSRGQFLRLSAMTAVATILTACNAPATTPTTAPQPTTAPKATEAPKPAATAATTAPTAAPAATATTAAKPAIVPPTFTPAQKATTSEIQKVVGLTYSGPLHEAPMLADQVKAGKLPAIEKRLPEHPYVVPHKWITQGKYGGWLQEAVSSKTDQGYNQMQEHMYGHSPLRWLRDGLDIGPGLAEKWEANTDLSEWTLYFRKGLRWSDGEPWTVDDILFWWDDEVQMPDLKELPPDECRSGKGTLVTMKKVDDFTLKMIFDAPAPLTADRLAMWVKRGQGGRWMDPKHYLQQYHIKYTPNLDKAKWVDDFIFRRDVRQNPDSPTMTGWKLKVWNKGQSQVWERNPFYWCIDKWGNQLPYIDGITQTNYQDPQVFRLSVTDGKLDYIHGGFTPLTLADVSMLTQSLSKINMELWYWDGGGGGSGPFFNQTYKEEKLRKIFQNAKFLHAMSYAMDRPTIQRVVWYGTGEITTGTMSPKAFEFHVPGGEEIYALWRDNAKEYNPTKAKQLLDELGLKDVNNDGWRELPDGSPMLLTLDYHASQDPNGYNLRQDEIIAKNWQAVGVNTKLNPVPDTAWDDQWNSGQLQNRADWGVGDGPNLLVFPQWLVPIEPTRWGAMFGKWYEVKGTPKETQELDVDPFKRNPPRMKPDDGSAVDKIWKIYDGTKVEPDQMKRTKAVWDMIKIFAAEGPFFYGTVANVPMIVMVRKGLKNVPKQADLDQGGFTGPWIIPSPAVYDPEAYYWDNPDEHKQT